MHLYKVMTLFSWLFQVACTASEEDMGRNHIELKWVVGRKLYSRSGDFIEFKCKRGYLEDPASSPFRVQCMEGRLNYPQCKPGSKSFPLCPQLSHCVVVFSVLKPRGKPFAFLGERLGRSQGVGASHKLQVVSWGHCYWVPELERLLGKGLSADTNSFRASGLLWEVYRQIMKVPFAGNCTVDERTMGKNNIQLQSSSWWSTPAYQTGDYILFECRWWHRKISRPEKFRAQCLDGVIAYPLCECKWAVPRTRQGCRRQLCQNCLLWGSTAVCQAWSSRLFPFFLFTLQDVWIDGNGMK